MTLDRSTKDDEFEKLLPIWSNLFGVPESSIWTSQYERYSWGNIKAFVLNIFASESNEMEKVNAKLKSPSFLKTINKECKKKKIRDWAGDILKFRSITNPSTERIKGIKIVQSLFEINL